MCRRAECDPRSHVPFGRRDLDRISEELSGGLQNRFWILGFYGDPCSVVPVSVLRAAGCGNSHHCRAAAAGMAISPTFLECVSASGGRTLCFGARPCLLVELAWRRRSVERPGVSAGMRAVIIGGGLGGLATALRLSAGGWKVTLCEAGSTFGGKMNCHQEAGYRFDTGPSLITMPDVFADLYRAAGERIEDHLTLIRKDPHAEYRFPDGVRI